MLNLQVIRLISFLFLNHIFFTGELLLEWLSVNCDARNSSLQTFLQQLKSCLHSTSNTNSNDNDLRKVNILIFESFNLLSKIIFSKKLILGSYSFEIY
jgi:hypothetical protein